MTATVHRHSEAIHKAWHLWVLGCESLDCTLKGVNLTRSLQRLSSDALYWMYGNISSGRDFLDLPAAARTISQGAVYITRHQGVPMAGRFVVSTELLN